MQKRYGKFLADWRDAAGVRRRKAFDTLQEAAEHAEKMRALAHPELPNRSAQRPPLRKPLRSGPVRNRKTRTLKRRSQS